MKIKKAVVIGAGVMGAGIAAQLANAGIEVELLDRVATDGNDRDAYAKSAVAKMLKDRQNPFMHKRNSKLVRTGNTEDNMDRLKEADLIIEAVFEDPKVKHDIFKKIDKNRKAGSIIGSNTSTIPLKNLIEGQSDDFKKDFMITHFFNPPRYMQLLELVTSKETRRDAVDSITNFIDEKLGKGVIECHDTPGFIANRIGTFWIQSAINESFERGIGVEEADALIGRPMGIPKTGIFGLVDVVGLDLMPKISASLLDKLPETDQYNKIAKEYDVITKMIADGYTGRKGKGGFYRLNKANGKKVKEVVDLKTGEYSPAKRPKPDAIRSAVSASKKGENIIKALMQHESVEGEYSWAVMKATFKYAASLVPEIADDIVAVDSAMRMGYNWETGPFEMIDNIGLDWFIEKLEAEGSEIPPLLKTAQEKGGFYRIENNKKQFMSVEGEYKDIPSKEGVLLLSDIKLQSEPVLSSKAGNVWNIGDGVLCFEFTTKKNTLDISTMNLLNKTMDLIESNDKYTAMVIHNEADLFSGGANLEKALTEVAKSMSFKPIKDLVKSGQETYKRMKYSNFPVVGAPSGVALGGGCEILLHCDKVTAHAELYMGLVEVGVGLVPAWGGCTEMLTRASQSKKIGGGPIPALSKVFETIGMAAVSSSAEDARSKMFLRKDDKIVMNKNRLLFEAKSVALEMVKAGYTPEEPVNIRLPGKTGHTAINLAVDGFYNSGLATPYDVVVNDQLAEVLSGGKDADITVETTQDQIRVLELQAFMRLTKDIRTIKRMVYIVKKSNEKVMKRLRTIGFLQKADTGASYREGADKKDRTSQQLRADMRAPSLMQKISSMFCCSSNKSSGKKTVANVNKPTCAASKKTA